MPRNLALFDFDGTLVTDDSLPRFVAACVGWPRMLLCALIAAIGSLGANDRRTKFKAIWLRLALRGFPAAKIPQAAARLEKALRWMPPQRARLLWHKQRGDVVVVASGGLDLYLPHILQGLGVDHLLCTSMAVDHDAVTGIMASGNCVREEKARRAAALINATGPYEEIWAYGNLPHDLPLLALATHRVVV